MGGPIMRRRLYDLPTGVYRDNRSMRYYAQVRHEGKHVYLGTFDTPDEAAEVVAEFRKFHNKDPYKWTPPGESQPATQE